MRKFICAVVFVNLLMLHCKSGDEAPPEPDMIVSFFLINTVENFGWQGQLTSQTCVADPAINGTLTCPGFQALEAETIQYVPKNGILLFQLANNRLTGTMTMTLPHFNLIPTNVYQITSSFEQTQGYDSTGTTNDGSDYQPVMRNVTRETQSSCTVYPIYCATSQNNTVVELADFSAQQDPHNLTGTMKLRFSQPNSPFGALLVTYGFKFDKMF